MKTISCLLAASLIWPAAPAAADQDLTSLYGPEKGRKGPNSAQFLNRHFTLLEHAMLDLVMISYSRDVQADQFLVAWYLKDYKPGDAQKEAEMVKKLLGYYEPAGDSKKLEEALAKLVKSCQPTGDAEKDRETVAGLMADLKAKDKSGYFFDRAAKHSSAWEGYQKAIGLLRKQQDEYDRNKEEKSFDPAPAQVFASAMRGTFREIAAGYLKDTDGKGDPLMLSLFESDLLFAYLKWVPNVEDVMREWLKVVNPQSPEDRYLQELRIGNSRALLRSGMKRYLENPPSGIQDPAQQYAQVAGLAKALLENDRKELDALYAKAGMTVPVKPVPKPTARDPQPKPFVYQFTDQEHAVLTYLILVPESPIAKEFAGDQKAADSPDAEASLAASLVAKWRERVKGQAILYLEPEEQRAQAAQNPSRLGVFESTYVEWRLERVDPRTRDHLRRLEDEADQETKKGDKEAGQRLANHLRGLIRKDLDAYVRSGGKEPDTALRDWARAALTPQAGFARLFPRPKSEEESPRTEETAKSDGNSDPKEEPLREDSKKDSQNGPAIGAALEALLENPVERAVTEYLVSVSTDQAAQAGLVAMAQKPEEDPERLKLVLDLRKRAAATIKDHLASPSAPLESFLAGKGIQRERLLEYYCPLLAASPAAPGSQALEDLKALAGEVGEAVKAPSAEAASVLSEVEPARALAGECLGWYGARKKENVVGKSQDEFKPALTVRKSSQTVPSPEETPRKETAARKSSLESKAVAATLTGALMGYMIVGLLGALLGLGPVALLGAALYGAVAGAWIAHSVSKKDGGTA